MSMSKAQQIVLALAFAVFILIMFCMHLWGSASAVKAAAKKPDLSTKVAAFEAGFNAQYAADRGWVNLYGLANRALGKREVSNFAVIEDGAASLYSPTASYFNWGYSEEVIANEVVDSIASVSDAAEGIGASMLFTQAPYKNWDSVPELDGYAPCGMEESFDEIVDGIRACGTACLDLRDVEECRSWYRTDHHWTSDASLAATGAIAKVLEKDGFELDGSRVDPAYYERTDCGECFLGSAGVKVGELYAGMDDFSYLAPTFDVAAEHRHLVGGKEDACYSGGFEETFIDLSKLDDHGYYNKYNAFLHGGYVENRVVNKSADNDLKCLFVAHSYGRPMTMYLSMLFGETRYLDPQPGRFDGNICDYIRSWRPDVVIVMYDGVLNSR